MGDDDNKGDSSNDKQQATDEKARVADTPESDPRESDGEGAEEN